MSPLCASVPPSVPQRAPSCFHCAVYFTQVNDALKEEMKDIHALSIKKALTPAQQVAAATQQQQQPQG